MYKTTKLLLCMPLLLACSRLGSLEDLGEDGGSFAESGGTDDTDEGTGDEAEGGEGGDSGGGGGGLCLGLGQGCDGGGCCGDLFCPEFLGYVPPVCEPRRQDGEYCIEESECLSGVCADNLCGGVACVVPGDACEFDSICCGGYCDQLAYGPGECVPLGQAGAYCLAEFQCASGVCTDNACA